MENMIQHLKRMCILLACILQIQILVEVGVFMQCIFG